MRYGRVGTDHAGVGRRADVPADVEAIDVGQRYIAPGLIDIHTHGALGHSFNEPDIDAFAIVTREQATRGVTALLATIATAPVEDIVRCCEVARTAMAARQGAQILGVHLEGPYFSVAQCGAQDPAHMRTPDDGSVDRYLEHHDITRIVSFAPELPGAIPFTPTAGSARYRAGGGSQLRKGRTCAGGDAGRAPAHHPYLEQPVYDRSGRAVA